MPKSCKDQGVDSAESANVTVAKGNDTEGGGMDRRVDEPAREERLGTDKSRENVEVEGDKQQQEMAEMMGKGQSASALGAADVKGQDQPTTAGSNGSANSSDSSSTHTYNAECSQRPAASLLSSDSSHNCTPSQLGSSLEMTKDSSRFFLDTLSQVRDLHDRVHGLLDEKCFLSQTELLACLQTLDKVTRTATKFSETLVRNTQRSQSNQQDTLL